MTMFYQPIYNKDGAIIFRLSDDEKNLEIDTYTDGTSIYINCSLYEVETLKDTLECVLATMVQSKNNE